jgi:hypothetical protein
VKNRPITIQKLIHVSQCAPRFVALARFILRAIKTKRLAAAAERRQPTCLRRQFYLILFEGIFQILNNSSTPLNVPCTTSSATRAPKFSRGERLPFRAAEATPTRRRVGLHDWQHAVIGQSGSSRRIPPGLRQTLSAGTTETHFARHRGTAIKARRSDGVPVWFAA